MRIGIKIIDGALTNIVFNKHAISFNNGEFFEIATTDEKLKNTNIIKRAFKLLVEPSQSLKTKIGYYDIDFYNLIFKEDKEEFNNVF